VEYVRHPRRLREFLLFLAPGVVAGGLVVVHFKTEESLPVLSSVCGVAALLVFFACFGLLLFRANTTRCPRCGRRLRRPRRTTDFVCHDCDVTWLCRDWTN